MEKSDYQLILQNLTIGYAYHRLIVDGAGEPIDYEFIEVNAAFEEATKLKRSEIIGQRVTAVVPGVRESKFNWIQHYGKVALEGKPCTFEQYFAPHGTWYSIYAFAPRPGFFVTLVSAISRDYAFQQLLANEATNLLSANEQNFSHKVRKLLEKLGHWISAQRCYLLVIDRDGKNMGVEEEWCADNIAPLPEAWAQITIADLAWWQSTVFAEDHLCYDVTQLPAHAHAERALLASAQINFWACLPIIGPQGPWGFLAFDCGHHDRHWKNEHLRQLKVFATLLSEVVVKIKKDHDLRVSEEKFRKISESIEEVVWLRSADNQQILYISPSYEKVWGRSCSELYQYPQAFLESVHKDDRGKVLQAFRSADRLKNSDLEYRICRPDGEIRWVRARNYQLRDDQDKVLNYSGMAIDITDQKILLQQLAQKTEQFAAALAGSNDGIWEVDLRENTVFFSERYKEMIGYLPQELENHFDTFFNLLHPEDRPLVEQKMDDYLSGRCDQYQVDFRFRHKQGHYIWVMARGAGLKDHQGKIYRMAGSHTDITHRKETEERWSTYFAHAPYGIFICNSLGQYLEVNPKACQQTGFSADELVRMSIGDLLPPEGKEVGWAHFQRLRQLGSAESNLILCCKDGSRRYFSVVATKLTEDRYLGFTQDITQQHLAEQEKILMQQQLLQTAKMASIGELAAGVGHEINNPLSIISASVELLENSGELAKCDQISAPLAKIKNSIERMRHIVDGLKMYARTDRPEQEPCDLHLLVQHSVQLVAEIYRKNNISIQLDLGATKNWIKAHEGRIQQVLMNLLSNSKDAMSGKGGLIMIASKNQGESLILQVSDSGVGIAPEHLAKVFETFFTTKEVGQGTGIGLSICYQIVTEAQGTINVESQVGKGTTFTISFPSIQVPLAHAAGTGLAPSAPGTLVHTKLAGRILVVDDENDLRELLAILLSKLGMEVTLASNGANALAELNGQEFDVVITDLTMPGMNGLELISKMKAQGRKEKIVVMTGGVDLDGNSKEQGQLNQWADGQLAKPFGSQRLQEVLKQVLGR